MAISRDILKSWFETGDKPTQQQFADLIDSLFHKSEDGWVPTNVEDVPGGKKIHFANGQSLIVSSISNGSIENIVVDTEGTELLSPDGFGDAQIFVNEIPKFDGVSIVGRITSGNKKLIKFNPRNKLRVGWIVTFKI